MAEIGQRRRALLAAPDPRACGAMLVVLSLAYAAWMWGFTIDDALISIRYARHLASGVGYRFDVNGPSTDGVTPLPWPFVLAPLARAPALEVLLRAKVLNLGAWLVAAFVLGKRIGEIDAAPWHKLVALVVTALSLPVAAGSVSGMETGVVVALATLASERADREKMYFACMLAGISAAFRPEMVVWAAALALGLSAPSRDARRVAGALARALAPFVVCALVRVWAFGRPAPLSVLAKPSDLAHGSVYAVAAALTALGPVLALAPIAIARSRSTTRALALAALAHLFAVAAAGGDWMPYGRLVAPIVPSLAIVFVRSASEARAWSTASRSMLALGLGLWVAITAAPRGRHVARDREALIDASRPYLQDAHVVATADIGWPSAATEADFVDLAGLTDPNVAVLPGGHTSKRLDPSFVLEKKPDVILLYATAGVTAQSLDDWTTAEYEKLVDVRLASSPAIRDRFVAVGFLPLGSAGAGYVVLAPQK